jgi:hypothetical protein
MYPPEQHLEAVAPAKTVDVWRTDALMTLAQQHEIDLLSLVPHMAERGSGKIPLGDSGYWIEFWTVDQGTSADGLYLRHVSDDGADHEELT